MIKSVPNKLLYYGAVSAFSAWMLAASTIVEWLIWFPIIIGMALFFNADQPKVARFVSLITGLFGVGLLVPLCMQYRIDGGMQFIVNELWMPGLGIRYALGIDGFALPLIALTTIFTPLIILAGWRVIEERVGAYMGCFLMLQGIMVGVFAATDAVLFYIFFEAMLIPMFLIIGIWGGPNRIYATIKFFIFTFMGSIFMLLALIYLYVQARAQGLADPSMISTFAQVALNSTTATWLAIAFCIAFAVKIPMFGVHTWLPDAHVEAPTGGSVILAAIMLKIGGYGMLRFMFPIVPEGCAIIAPTIIVLSLIAIVYIGMVAIVQRDMKKLIAYSSVAHMGFVTLGLFMAFAALAQKDGLWAAQLGIQGAYLQMISHGFISGALFLCVGILYDRIHSRLMQDYGGVANTMPRFAAFFMLFIMANAGLPATSGFVGEFMVIVGAWKANWMWASIAAATLILGAAYNLWLYKRVVFGKVIHQGVANLKDMNLRETTILTILAIMVMGLGLYPAVLTQITQPAVNSLLQTIIQS